MKRRDFIKALPLGVAAAGIPFALPGFSGRAFAKGGALDAILNGTDTSDRVLVLINLQGGNDGLNTVIPFQDSHYDKSRGTIGFVSAAEKASLSATLLNTQIQRPDLAINPAFGMKYASGVPSFYDLFTAGKVAVINNVGYPSPNLSHFRSTDIWNTASDSNVVLTTGWLGRWLQDVDPGYPLDVKAGDDPLAITIGGAMNPVFQGSSSGMGIAVLDPSNYLGSGAPQNESVPSTNAGAELSYVRGIYAQSDAYTARFQGIIPHKPTNNVQYPSTSIAAQFQKVAWCIAAGMKTKVYFVQLGGFDTHINQNSKDTNVSGQGSLLMQLGQAIAAFQTDLEKFGMADRVIGMTYSEFGRRVNENASNGTDHGTCAPQIVFGTQVNGEVYSSTPNLGNLDSNGDLVWKVDFRQLYTAVLGDWFGVSESLRKAILMDKSTTGETFGFNIPINGSTTVQSIIRTPASSGVGPTTADSGFVFDPIYPNPVRSSATLSFALARTMQTSLEVYDERGEKVAELVRAMMGQGAYDFTLDARTLASGTYIARLEAGSQVQVRQIKVVR